MGPAYLRGVKATLAAMSDTELDAVSGITYQVPQIAPGLLAWLDYACIWQIKRRAGHDEELYPPQASIPPEDIATSIAAAAALRARFADSRTICAFFDALIALLSSFA